MKNLDIFYDKKWIEECDDVYPNINVFGIHSVHDKNDYTIYVDKDQEYICVYNPGDIVWIHSTNCTYAEYLHIIDCIADVAKNNIKLIKKVIRYLKIE